MQGWWLTMHTKIRVDVDGRRQRQVLNFEDSRPQDRHFVLETDKDGKTVLVFGDGEHGARLPAGTRSVVVTYRSSKRYSGVKLAKGRAVLDDDWNQPPETPRRYCCLYRTEVVDSEDPSRRLRLQIMMPEALGRQAVWALPCVPVGALAVPPVGATVWAMFEGGDLSMPVWVGTMGSD